MGKKRALQNGTIVDVNEIIRSHIHHKGSNPASGDLEHAMAIDASEEVDSALLKADARKAHRRCKTLAKDYRYQLSRVRLGGQMYHYINKVGTYGMADAQFKWGRLIGVVHRTILAFGFIRWLFTYVDDILALLRRETMWLEASALITLLLALGFPFSWKKLLVSLQGEWTGRFVSCPLRTITPTTGKRRVVEEFLERIVDGDVLPVRAAVRGVAQTRWVAQNVHNLAVFLQPLHAWAAVLKNPGKPSALHRCVAEYAIAMLSSEPTPARFLVPFAGEAATDASATPTQAVVGGWVSSSFPAAKSSAQWFCIVLDRQRFWWVWSRAGDPRRVVGALELLAHVFLVRMLGPRARGAHIRSRLGVSTDNQGNAFASMKEYSRRLPSAAVHMELAAAERASSFALEVSHVRREHNTWADQLTHPDDLSEWLASNRWVPEVDDDFFLVLDKVLAVWSSSGVAPACRPSGSAGDAAPKRRRSMF